MSRKGENLQVELTEAEKTLVARIDFRHSGKGYDAESWRPVVDAMDKLMQSLVARKAIPEVRRRYFSNPTLNIGGHGFRVAKSLSVMARAGVRSSAIRTL